MTDNKLRIALARALERCEVADDKTGAADEAAAILREVVDLDGKAAATDNIKTAEEAMGFEADTRINLLDEPMSEPHGPGQRQYQRHIAIEWEGGVLWLNTFDFVNTEETDGEKHFCIDVRQFNSAGKVKGEGVFTMSRGYRGSIATINPEGDDESMVKGRGWNGGYVVCILTDPDGEETHTDDERKKD
jgi:hypothetical protein